MKQLFVATSNLGKQRELRALFAGFSLELVFPQDLEATRTIDVDETGTTFAENAWLKAQAFAAASGMRTLADDSGLEVLGLNNFPGIKSNRWFTGSDAERNAALLEKMSELIDRSAQYVAVMCLYEPATQTATYAKGVVTGRIATAEQGSGVSGFGYDPLFIPDGYDKSFAELGNDVKNELSHRARAHAQLTPEFS